MFVTLLTLVSGHFVMRISEIHNQVRQLPMTTSGKKKRKKIGQSDFC